ncbi:hypothetical protein LguiB_005771 [Lonicera macranthoides]
MSPPRERTAQLAVKSVNSSRSLICIIDNSILGVSVYALTISPRAYELILEVKIDGLNRDSQNLKIPKVELEPSTMEEGNGDEDGDDDDGLVGSKEPWRITPKIPSLVSSHHFLALYLSLEPNGDERKEGE